MAKIYTRKEYRRRKVNYQIAAGLYDFISIVIGIVVIIACIVLIISIFSWVIRDGQSSFESLWNLFLDAIIIPEGSSVSDVASLVAGTV